MYRSDLDCRSNLKLWPLAVYSVCARLVTLTNLYCSLAVIQNIKRPILFSQLLFDGYEDEATAIRRRESIEACSANDKLFDLVKPHLNTGKYIYVVPAAIKSRW